MLDSSDTKDSWEPNVWAYLLPFMANMLLAMRFTPDLGPESIDDVSVNTYFYLVIAQVVIAIAICAFFLRTYLREFPLRIDYWAVVVGVVGFFLWIGICEMGIEKSVLKLIGLESWFPERVGFNPFDQITDDNRRLIFLGFRFLLLAAMVPLLEELFIRGWLVRYVENPDWHTVKLTDVGRTGIMGIAIYAIATHPGEAIAAIVWSTLVTIMMIKTGKFWNCVVAHMITNLMLGIYVIQYEQWALW